MNTGIELKINRTYAIGVANPIALHLTTCLTRSDGCDFMTMAILPEDNYRLVYERLKIRFTTDGLAFVSEEQFLHIRISGVFTFPLEWSVMGARIYARNVLNDQDRWMIGTHLLRSE